MTLKQFIEQIRREALRDPKKALVLGLLTAVAVYFWAPLVSDWLGGAPEQLYAPDELSSAGGGLAAFLPGQPKQQAGDKEGAAADCETGLPAWHVIHQWVVADPRMEPLKQAPIHRSPFIESEEVKIQLAGVQVIEEQPAERLPPPPSMDDIAAGVAQRVELSLAHPARPAVVIDGHTYHPGDVLVVHKDGQSIPLKITDIDADVIVVAQQPSGVQFEVFMPRPSGEMKVYHAQNQAPTEATN